MFIDHVADFPATYCHFTSSDKIYITLYIFNINEV